MNAYIQLRAEYAYGYISFATELHSVLKVIKEMCRHLQKSTDIHVQ